VEQRLSEAQTMLAIQHQQQQLPHGAGPPSLGAGAAGLLREAALLALGSVADLLQEATRVDSFSGRSGASSSTGGGGSFSVLDHHSGSPTAKKRSSSGAVPKALSGNIKARVQAIIETVLVQDLQVRPCLAGSTGGTGLKEYLPVLPCSVQGSCYSNNFLAGRAMWVAAKLSELMTPQQVDMYLQAACAGRRPSCCPMALPLPRLRLAHTRPAGIRGAHLPAALRVGACRALTQLLPLALSLPLPLGAMAPEEGATGPLNAAVPGQPNASTTGGRLDQCSCLTSSYPPSCALPRSPSLLAAPLTVFAVIALMSVLNTLASGCALIGKPLHIILCC
jgi:hypothetical protein